MSTVSRKMMGGGRHGNRAVAEDYFIVVCKQEAEYKSDRAFKCSNPILQ